MCQKPVCSRHARWQGHNIVCVTCLRSELKNPYRKHSYAYLRDDPYFFWYFREGSFLNDPYGDEDYALFESSNSDRSFQQDWESEGDWGAS